MNFKKINLLRVIVLLSLLMTDISFGGRGYDLDEFDDLELESLDSLKKIPANKIDKGQGLILFGDVLYLLDDDFDFGENELELQKLELAPNGMEIAKEYEDFLNVFFENSTLVRPSYFENSNPPIIKQEKSNPLTKIKIENLTPEDSSYFENSNPPLIKQEGSNPSITTIKNQLFIVPRIGFGMNYVSSFNVMGIITGGSISYGNGNNKWGNIGVDLMYIMSERRRHTLGITGFYERTILKYIALKGGVGVLKTGDEINIGVEVGTGLSFPIGELLIIQPMAEIKFGTSNNNIMGINLNIGLPLETSLLNGMFGNNAE